MNSITRKFLYKISILSLLSFSPLNLAAKTPDCPNPWENLAVSDLNAIKEALSKHSAPAAAQDDDFNKWLEQGYKKAIQLAHKSQTFSGYLFSIRYYVAGFRDGHISYYPNFLQREAEYPGFLIQTQANQFFIGYKDSIPELKDIPLGAEVVQINNLSPANFIRQHIAPFTIGGYGDNYFFHLAPYILIKNNNPFAIQPTHITLRSGGIDRKVVLKFRTIQSGRLANMVNNLSFGEAPDVFKITQMDEGAWVSIPSFNPTSQEVPEMEKMLKSLSSLRSKKWVIFDVRGNGGGNSDFERALIRNFYGDAYLKSLGKQFDYNHTWIKKIRATDQNFLDFKEESEPKEVKDFENALKKGESFYTYEWSIFDEKNYLFTNLDQEIVQAKVYLLTDGWCSSTCWLLINEMLQIPGVVQIGEETSIQSPYSQTRWISMPSGLGKLICPMQVRIFPNKHLGHSFKPQFVFPGNWGNQEALKAWVLQMVKS